MWYLETFDRQSGAGTNKHPLPWPEIRKVRGTLSLDEDNEPMQANTEGCAIAVDLLPLLFQYEAERPPAIDHGSVRCRLLYHSVDDLPNYDGPRFLTAAPGQTRSWFLMAFNKNGGLDHEYVLSITTEEVRELFDAGECFEIDGIRYEIEAGGFDVSEAQFRNLATYTDAPVSPFDAYQYQVSYYRTE